MSGRRTDTAGAPTQIVTDPAWRTLYRVGAYGAVLYVVLIVIPILMVAAAPQPPVSGGAAVLMYIAGHRAAYLTELVCFVGLSLPALIVFLALGAALWTRSRTLAAVGGLIGVASEVVALSMNSSPPSLHGGLWLLAEQYAATADAARRAALEAAAEGLMALSNAVNAAGLLTALGILLVSLGLRRGVSSRAVAGLGIVTGVVGLVSEALRPLIGAAYYLYGLLLPLWFVAVGWTLWRLSGAAEVTETSI